MKNDLGSALVFVDLAQRIFRAAITKPVYGFCRAAFFVSLGPDLHFIGNHEATVKSQTEMADQCVLVGVAF